MSPRNTVEPTPELKAKFAEVTRGAQAASPNFTLACGGERLDIESMIKHVRDETDIGLQLLTIFAQEEADREATEENKVRSKLRKLISRGRR